MKSKSLSPMTTQAGTHEQSRRSQACFHNWPGAYLHPSEQVLGLLSSGRTRRGRQEQIGWREREKERGLPGSRCLAGFPHPLSPYMSQLDNNPEFSSYRVKCSICLTSIPCDFPLNRLNKGQRLGDWVKRGNLGGGGRFEEWLVIEIITLPVWQSQRRTLVSDQMLL